MRRGAKLTKPTVTKPPVPRKSRKNQHSRIRDLEKRLAGAQKREAEALKRETEAQEQQTATAEILGVISRSPTDVQPVFDSIAESSLRVCGALFSSVYRFDGELVHMVAQHNYPPAALELSQRVFPARPSRQLFSARAILERAVVHVADILADDNYAAQELLQSAGFRSALAVPMMRGAEPIGAIGVWHADVGPFTNKHIALLQTFADQAVIAIENVRLFKELEARNRELTEALERQTATSEVLKAISRSTFDLQPVLETLIENATRLCSAQQGFLFTSAGELHHLAVEYNAPPTFREWVHRRPLRTGDGSVVGRVALEGRVVQIFDAQADAEWRGRNAEAPGISDVRTLLGVPMRREGVLIGVIAMWRTSVRPFTDKELELIETFADQAVIAIENVRLFNEIESKNRQLEVASQHKSEFLANMSHELRTPLNAVIGFSEVLLQRMFGEVNDKQDEYLKDIYASGQHLLSLINDILDLSKIEAGRMELALAPFHLPTALDNAVTLVRSGRPAMGSPSRSTSTRSWGSSWADERKVKQVLLNLLSNAVKFTPEGGRISLKAGRKDGLVEIAVTDTGIGIAREDQAAIFEEFRQVGTDETRKQEGTGLGLTLAKKFVELHGGRIWVASEPNRGSIFTFTLPVRPWLAS